MLPTYLVLNFIFNHLTQSKVNVLSRFDADSADK